ncbi:MAG: bifunctional riboflavin kinase/FAD synthetase [Bdellovibrionales bacterium]
MKVLRDIKQLSPQLRSSSRPQNGSHEPSEITRSVVSIGNFDGVHLGHRALLQNLLQKSRELQAKSVVMTFDPHPMQILYPEKKLIKLFDRDDQISELEKMGIDYLFIQPFSRELSQMSPETFLKEIIFEPLSPIALVVGYDFSFGANRSGNIPLLEKLSQEWGFELQVVPPLRKKEQIISSSYIREKIKLGEMEKAQEALSRPFYLKGVVIKGAQRGRHLGFPTVNIASGTGVAPSPGVYVTHTQVKGQFFPSVTNVGFNPTFEDDRNSQKNNMKIETYILDFDQDLYGEVLSVDFFKKLRVEKKFSSIQELKKQITEDVQMTRDFFRNYKDLKK